ncbi:hypothetical protein EMCRGX_G021823 [Ephydatia muelleri]
MAPTRWHRVSFMMGPVLVLDVDDVKEQQMASHFHDYKELQRSAAKVTLTIEQQRWARMGFFCFQVVHTCEWACLWHITMFIFRFSAPFACYTGSTSLGMCQGRVVRGWPLGSSPLSCSTSSTSGREDLSYPPSQKFSGTPPVPASITPDDLSDFTALYREHCKVMSCTQVSIAQRSAIWVLGILQAILDVVQNLQFQMVENLWLNF